MRELFRGKENESTLKTFYSIQATNNMLSKHIRSILSLSKQTQVLCQIQQRNFIQFPPTTKDYFAVCGNAIRASYDKLNITKTSPDTTWHNTSFGALEMKYGNEFIYRYKFKINRCQLHQIMIGMEYLEITQI